LFGGAVVDADGRTTVPWLWAAGEVTSSGLHGANRLASNSLLEGLVFGRTCGQGAAQVAAEMPDRFAALPLDSDWPRGARDDDELNLVDLRNSLSSEMWRDVGIRRDQSGLESAERQVDFWNKYVAVREFADPQGWELQNMLLVSRLIIAGALARRESRGTHFRKDFPHADPAQAQHIEISATE
jgi:L-aspartate oxidase